MNKLNLTALHTLSMSELKTNIKLSTIEDINDTIQFIENEIVKNENLLELTEGNVVNIKDIEPWEISELRKHLYVLHFVIDRLNQLLYKKMELKEFYEGAPQSQIGSIEIINEIDYFTTSINNYFVNY